MSTLRTNALEGMDAKNSITIVAGAGNITTTNVQEGLCKAWCRMNMATPAYSDSFNLGTITDNGTGDMTFAITNAFNGATFACTSGDGNDNALDEGITTTTARQVSRDNSGTKGDSDRVSFVAHGDLA
tara:strand:- start:30 stop:413 length:384 start_codon:yes stop_codon:yes gene_type:complete